MCETTHRWLSNQQVKPIKRDFMPNRWALYRRSCIETKCETCGPHLINNLNNDDKDNTFFLIQWPHKITDHVKRKTVVEQQYTRGDVLNIIKVEIPAYSKHIFNAKWQYRQLNAKKIIESTRWRITNGFRLCGELPFGTSR